MSYQIQLKLPSEGTWKPVFTAEESIASSRFFDIECDFVKSDKYEVSTTICGLGKEFVVSEKGTAARREWVRSYRLIRS